MIQQQQQKTSQWVLTSVQFNLVFTNINSGVCVCRRVCRHNCRQIFRKWCHYRVLRPYLDPVPFFDCPPNTQTLWLKYSSEIMRNLQQLQTMPRDGSAGSVNIFFPHLNRWDFRPIWNIRHFTFVVRRE